MGEKKRGGWWALAIQIALIAAYVTCGFVSNTEESLRQDLRFHIAILLAFIGGIGTGKVGAHLNDSRAAAARVDGIVVFVSALLGGLAACRTVFAVSIVSMGGPLGLVVAFILGGGLCLGSFVIGRAIEEFNSSPPPRTSQMEQASLPPAPTDSPRSSLSERHSRQRTGQLIEAGVPPMLYLLFAVPVILSCAGQNVWMQWYPAAFVTMPVSLFAEGIGYSPALFGHLVFALLNAGGLFLASYGAIRLWTDWRAVREARSAD